MCGGAQTFFLDRRLNCSPNDLALVVRNTYGIRCVDNIIGSPVQLTGIHSLDNFGFGPSWNYAGRLTCPNCGGLFAFLLDADLQPIRPPAVESVRDIIAELTA